MKTLVVLGVLAIIGAGDLAPDPPVRWLEHEEAPHVVTKAATIPFTSEVVVNAGEKAEITAAPGQKVTCETVTAS